MQTFLPFPSFTQTAAVLDRQRLGKQRVECMQILKAITEPSYGWQSHPTVNMWRHHPGSLIRYGVAICKEGMSRGYRDTCIDKIMSFGCYDNGDPDWLGNEEFHAAHRSNLLRKNPEHYRRYWPDEPIDLPYIWPSLSDLHSS